MSPDRRPSPLQPPVTNTYANNMAQVQQPPRLPTLSNFTGYAGDLTPPSHHTPAFHGPPSRHGSGDSGRLPPIQLPPLESTTSRPQNDPLSISNLLSRNPESPRQRRRPLPHQDAHRHNSFSPASGYTASPQEIRPHLPPFPPPPMQHVEPPPIHQMAAPLIPPMPQPIKSQQHWQAHPADVPPPHFRHHSGNQAPRSHYSSSSEPSPAIAAAPLHPFQHISRPPPVDYKLLIRQQPAAARACGYGERDRRVVDPPPILELRITDKATGHPEQDNACILALHCTLLSQDGTDEMEAPPVQDGLASTRRLMGTIVASPYQAKDEHGVAGTFFVFPDLSCRSPGKYRLRFKLIRVEPSTMVPGGVSPSVAQIVSDVFSVYTAKDFPGMRASSLLLKALRRQGLNVGVKKGSEARKGKGKAKKEPDSADEDDDSDHGTDDDDGRGSDASVGSGMSPDLSPKTAANKGKRRKTGGR